MNPFEMVAIIVVAVMIASVLRAKYGHSQAPWRRQPTRASRPRICGFATRSRS